MGLFTILKDIAKAKVARKLMRGGFGRAFLITYVAKKGYDLYRSRQRRRLGYTLRFQPYAIAPVNSCAPSAVRET